MGTYYVIDTNISYRLDIVCKFFRLYKNILVSINLEIFIKSVSEGVYILN